MNIGLLDVCGSLLESNVGLASIDKNISTDDTDGLAAGQYVEQSSFASTRCTHESGERAWLHITVNVIQELSVAARDRDGVIESFPSERSLALHESRQVLFNCTSLNGSLSFSESCISSLGVLVFLGKDDDGLNGRNQSSSDRTKSPLMYSP
jgi:hypothetical protein